MVKIDLVTGFLGSGKTTFIKEYATYLKNTDERICVLENDFGAINVDMMLLKDLQNLGIGLEMVAGGCDKDCYIRRFKTKLITMALLGYSRVIIEPSGIFEIDEFFDILHEDKISDMYELSNVFVLVDNNSLVNLSIKSKYLLASQISCAGKIVLSHIEKNFDLIETIDKLQNDLNLINCKRILKKEDFCLFEVGKMDFNSLMKVGYREYSYVKSFSQKENDYEAIFFMNSKSDVPHAVEEILKDKNVGNIIRIKGFYQENGQWIKINATKNSIEINPSIDGQKVIIIIGENLNKKQINNYLPSEYSTIKVYEEALKNKI